MQPDTRERTRIRDYMRVVRATVLAPHPYNKQTCCGECRRIYNRDEMRKLRNPGQLILPFVANYPIYNNP